MESMFALFCLPSCLSTTHDPILHISCQNNGNSHTKKNILSPFGYLDCLPEIAAKSPIRFIT